jgi:hypothetical protein
MADFVIGPDKLGSSSQATKSVAIENTCTAEAINCPTKGRPFRFEATHDGETPLGDQTAQR